MHPDHQSVGELAYRLWQARGCPQGTAEEDWLEAERQLADLAFENEIPPSPPPSLPPSITPSRKGSTRSRTLGSKPVVTKPSSKFTD